MPFVIFHPESIPNFLSDRELEGKGLPHMRHLRQRIPPTLLPDDKTPSVRRAIHFHYDVRRVGAKHPVGIRAC